MLSRYAPLFLAVIAAYSIASPLRALGPDDAYTINLPFGANAATPAWLGHPETPTSAFGSLSLPIQPPDTTSSLLVTVYFVEKPEGFLRIIWNGAQGSQTLTSNFYEGIGMANQRSLLISADTLQGGGTFVLQSSDQDLGVQKIKLQWLENRNGLVAADIDDTMVTSAPGKTETAQALDGQPAASNTPEWKGELVVAPLIDAPLRIEQGADFSFQIDSAPLAGRLVFKENGLPWNKHLVLWINQKRAATISPALPDLAEEGFWKDSTALGVYIGWRDGSAFVPVSLLKAGVNTIELSVEDDGAATDPGQAPAPQDTLPLAVKEMALELAYPPAESPADPVPAASTQASSAESSADPLPAASTDASGAEKPAADASATAPLPAPLVTSPSINPP